MPIVSLQQAISRLGLRALSDMAVMVAVRSKLFDEGPFGPLTQRMWRHALATGLFAKEVARTRRRNVESAFLCGLLHDVGKPVVLENLLSRRADLVTRLNPDIIITAMELFHTSAGAILTERWDMPDDVKASVRWHHDADSAPERSEVAMTVHFADMLADHTLPEPGRAVPADELYELPVLEGLNLYQDEVEQLLSCCDQVRESVESIG